MPDAKAPYDRMELAHLADAARLLEQGITLVHEAVGVKIRLANACSRLKGAERKKDEATPKEAA